MRIDSPTHENGLCHLIYHRMHHSAHGTRWLDKANVAGVVDRNEDVMLYPYDSEALIDSTLDNHYVRPLFHVWHAGSFVSLLCEQAELDSNTSSWGAHLVSHISPLFTPQVSLMWTRANAGTVGTADTLEHYDFLRMTFEFRPLSANTYILPPNSSALEFVL